MKRVLDALLQTDHEALGILCYAKDPGAAIRKRSAYVENSVLVLRFAAEPEGIVAYAIGEVPTAKARMGRVAQLDPIPNAIDDIDAPPPGVDNPGRGASDGGGYRRDDAVRAYVVARARGKCEHCGKHDFRMTNGHYYLEAHHIIRLADQGPDKVDNVIALCSTHHREAHYGVNAKALEKAFLEKLAVLESK